MARSSDLKDYFQAPLSIFRPEERVTFDVHLYLPQNQRIFVWRHATELLTETEINKLRSARVASVWIHREDTAAFTAYCKGAETKRTPATPPAPSAPPAQTSGAPPAPAASVQAVSGPAGSNGAINVNAPPPELAAKLKVILDNPKLTPEQRRTAAAQVAQDFLTRAIQANQKQQLSAEGKRIVQEIVLSSRSETTVVLDELLKGAHLDHDSGHGMHVSTYAVVFAMAFGKVDRAVLADIALAGLLHDIGMSQIPLDIVTKPWSQFSPGELQIYSRHVEAGLELLDSYEPRIPKRVRNILLQHHEKFDGSGYPRNLEAFQIDESTQLVSMADVLDAISTGRFDGREHTLEKSMRLIEALETSRNFPQFFNPDLFATVLNWMKNPAAQNAIQDAARTSGEEADNFLKTVKPGP